MSSRSGMSDDGAAEQPGHHQLLERLRESSSSIKGTFSCGGVLKPGATISLWYRKDSAASSTTLDLPASAPSLAHLLAACQPATFGRGSNTVLDESIRKALQLAPQDFCCNFNLAAHRLLEDVRDALLPPGQGVTAELYKLNVYGPGDHFKPHVDTPRGDNMFGSLVICLPQPFEGGQLAVRHAGREVVYDWAQKSAPGTTAAAAASSRTQATNAANAPDANQHLHWAAFYADCEHEILPVTSGHRLTLTYLLRSHSDGEEDEYDGVRSLVAADPRTLPLYHDLQAALASPHFMPRGGWLGFACQHAYVFTEEVADQLKGADRLLWLTLAEAGLDVKLKAQFDPSDFGEMEDVENSDEDLGDDADQGSEDAGVAVGAESAMLSDICSGNLLMERDFYEESALNFRSDVGGTVEKVVWVTRRRGKLGLYAAYISYGNEATLSSLYASVVILAKVPSKEERLCDI